MLSDNIRLVCIQNRTGHQMNDGMISEHFIGMSEIYRLLFMPMFVSTVFKNAQKYQKVRF